MRKAVRDHISSYFVHTKHPLHVSDGDGIDATAVLVELGSLLTTEAETLPKETIERLQPASRAAIESGDEDLGTMLLDLHAHETSEPPEATASKLLANRIPTVLLFDTDDRDLKSEYE